MPSTVPVASAMRRMISTVARAGHCEPGERLVGEGLERVSGEDGDGFAENDVAGGLAAAEIVVVERRQIVVDERIGVQHLDGCAEVFYSGEGIAAGDHARRF